MGRATRWFMSVFGIRRPDPATCNRPDLAVTPSRSKEGTRRWGFVKSYREKGRGGPNVSCDQEMSSTSSCSASHLDSDRDRHRNRQLRAAELAATRIQSAFRGYLARKALRALKGLVKIQALVRGYIERKRTAEWLYRMQALVRAQERARADRYRIPPLEHAGRARAGRIVEVDRRWNHPDRCFFTQSLSPADYAEEEEDYRSRRSPFTPTKSDGARSFGGGYLENPSYMSYTESSKAKARSISAPRQRGKRYSMQERSNSAKRGSLSKAYPGSGRLDHFGFPLAQRY